MQPHPHIVLAADGGWNLFAGGGGKALQVCFPGAAHEEHQRPDKKIKYHHGRSRMSGQTEKGAVPMAGKDGRFARPDGDAVRQQLGLLQFLEDGQGEITLAHRTAAGQQQQVNRPGKGGPAGMQHLLMIVADDAQRQGNTTSLQDHAGQGRGIDVPYLSGGGCLMRFHQLVARADDADQRFSENGNFRDAQPGQHAQILGPQAAAFIDNRGPLSEIITCLDDVFTRSHRFEYLDGRLVDLAGVFEHHHCIGPVGQFAAGPDAGGFAGPQADRAPAPPHGNLAAYGEQGWFRFAAAEGVPRPYRVTVHGGAGKGGQRLRSNNVFAEKASQSVGKGYPFAFTCIESA